MKRFAALCILLPLVLWAAPLKAAQPLVDAAWVVAHIGAPETVFLDVRANGLEEFRAGHVPGAVFGDYARAGWRTTDANGTPGMLPPVEALEALIGGLGIHNDHHVVIIARGKDALDMASATRVYWTFKVLGHDAVSILNGGMRAYAAGAANPLETGDHTPRAARFRAAFRPGLVASKEDVKNAISGGLTLVDNRPAGQFTGAQRHPMAARAGTIPGAKSAPQPWFTKGGMIRSEAELAAILAAQEIPEDGAIACFCNTGHMASMGWFVAYALLGNTSASVYDGSMVEWTADPDLPVARSAD